MIFTPGPLVAALSGSVGGTVASRNRGGAYFRFRAVPITSQTAFAQNARQRLATASQDWQGLSDNQRASWTSWALQNPVVNALGFPRHLTGHQAYVGINARRASAGDVAITAPPIVPAPDGLLTLVLEADIGTADVDITYTGTPTGATEKLYIQAAVTNSAGIKNVQNLLKLVGFSDAAQTSPFVIQTLVEDRLGTLIVDQKLHVQISVYDNATGLLSLPLADSAIVITT